jgi:hypothetical protein
MKKVFTNVKFFLIWVLNSLYSLKDLRWNTPISLPVFIVILIIWFVVLNYFLLF